MTTEQVLFALLREEICGEPVSQEVKAALSPEMLKALYDLSYRHDLAHLVGQALSKLELLGTDETSRKFQERTMRAVTRYIKSSHELHSVCNALEQAQIPHIPLKGSVIRQWYPEPWMRTCTDIDILVKKQDVERAAEILGQTLDYEKRKEGKCDISLFSPTGVHLELHFDLIEDAVSIIQGAVLSRIWNVVTPVKGYAFQYEMPGSWFRFYHYAHMAKHVTSGGCGIRPLMDLWIMNRRMEYDKAEEIQLLEEGRLVAFSKAMENLSEHWFSQMPTDEFGELLESYIFDGGRHGTFKNKVTIRQVKKGGKLKYALHRIFKPFDSLRKMYPILEKHKWLFPFCQIHRWIKLITHKNLAEYSAMELRMSAEMTREESAAVAELLNKLEI